MKKFLLFNICILTTLLAQAQGVIQSYIISIENGKAYLDITAPKAQVGDVLSVYEEAGYIIHPVTKKKIKKEGKILADLEIVETHSEYSVATVYPEEIIGKLKVGMVAEMPELPPSMENDIDESVDKVVDIEEVERKRESPPTSADGIIRRYLQVTGLNRLINGNNMMPYWMKVQISAITNKGKKITGSRYVARDLSKRKIFVCKNLLSKNLFDNIALAINGDEGWFRLKKGSTFKMKEKQINSFWEDVENIDAFGEIFYDESKWMRRLVGKKMVNGKNCTGISFVSMKKADVELIRYYNDDTGLIEYAEVYSKGKLLVQEYMLEYRKYGDLLICSNSLATYPKGNIKEQNNIVQDVCINCQLDDFLFTKEGVKNAFKDEF